MIRSATWMPWSRSSSAAERPAAVATIGSRSVDDELHGTVPRCRGLEHRPDARLVGDVPLGRSRAGRLDGRERLLRPRHAGDGPPLADEKLDHAAAEVP